MAFIFTAMEDAAIAKLLPSHYHRPATTLVILISTYHLTASPVRRKPKICRLCATTTMDDSVTVSVTD